MKSVRRHGGRSQTKARALCAILTDSIHGVGFFFALAWFRISAILPALSYRQRRSFRSGEALKTRSLTLVVRGSENEGLDFGREKP